ncbi:hypothetical protein [Halomontanus rarus]|uniref:hypothetical protein n=1 Tax=Halomontanus rarus TaxID=3034020 RepID=UPI001A99EBD1
MSTDLLREDESVAQSIEETLPESVGERIETYGNDGTLALVAGTVATAQGLRTVRKNRTGGALTMLWGASWLLVGLVQRQRRRSRSPESTAAETEGDLENFDDIGDVTPGDTDDEMAATNTLPPSDVGEPETQAPEDSDTTKTTAEPSEMTDLTERREDPDEETPTVPDEPPADDVDMIGVGGDGDGENQDN